MISVNSLFHSVFGGSQEHAAGRETPTQIAGPAERDEEEIFLASIADLTSEEWRARVERREFYRRMVERQALMEVEQHAEDAWG
ncbi:MAG: hypothetical protein IT320_20240 [Anaerolineae bacterium]|nr:hypothetical protein [Anaerolineae bacterium]